MAIVLVALETVQADGLNPIIPARKETSTPVAPVRSTRQQESG